MVTQTIINKIPFSYRTLQHIKANEYQRFFSKLDAYELYANHLGEIQWMTAEEAEKQHEFFIYEQDSAKLLNKIFYTNKTPDLDKVAQAEKEIRLQFRILLEENFLEKTTPETQRLIPPTWKYELKQEELLHIPISLDALKSRDWKKPAILLSIIALLIIAIFSFFILEPSEQTGQLIVQSNVEGGRIFLENYGFLGYTGTVIRNIPIGSHRISVEKKGYKITSKFYNIEIFNDSTQTIEVHLNPLNSQIEGTLKIIADQKDSDLFINSEYYGTIRDYPSLILEEGQYKVEVNKSGFITSPNEETVNITAGDTVVLLLEQVSINNYSKSVNVTSGNLDIASNISGAQIFLNGKNTGKETDYVFTNLPLGKYKVELSKEGYSVEPEESILQLSSSNPTREASFTLKKEFENITIESDQPNAPIFIDGELKGNGQLSTKLNIGKHEISFGNIEGFNSPSTKVVNIKPRLPLNIKVKYFPQMQILAEVTNNGNIRSMECDVIIGYTLAIRGFSPSDEAGPEVIYLENLKNYFWKLGFAFPLRNPKGNDAIQIAFRLPYELDYEQKFILIIDAAISEDKYPLSISRKVDISIKFNNNILSYYYQPKTLEKIGHTEPTEWDITSYIKPGANLLEIATTEKNNTYYFIKKIEIRN